LGKVLKIFGPSLEIAGRGPCIMFSCFYYNFLIFLYVYIFVGEIGESWLIILFLFGLILKIVRGIRYVS